MVECSVLTPPDFRLPLKCIFLLVNIGTSLLAIIGNGLVMLALFTYPKLRKRSNYFLLYLSITDMTVALIVQPMSCALVIDFHYAGQFCIVSVLMTYFAACMCGASFGMLTLISYDRYLHLSKLNDYNKYMTDKKFKVLVCIVFTYPTVVGSFMFHKKTVRVFYTLVVIISLFLMGIICFCYYKSWKIVKTKSMSTSTNKKTNKQWKVTKSIGLIVLFCITSWSPLSVFTFFQEMCWFIGVDFQTKYYPENLQILYFCLLCGFANSCMNPFLYYWRNKDIRQGMQLTIFEKIVCRHLIENQNNIEISNTSNSTTGMSKTSPRLDLHVPRNTQTKAVKNEISPTCSMESVATTAQVDVASHTLSNSLSS